MRQIQGVDLDGEVQIHAGSGAGAGGAAPRESGLATLRESRELSPDRLAAQNLQQPHFQQPHNGAHPSGPPSEVSCGGVSMNASLNASPMPGHRRINSGGSSGHRGMVRRGPWLEAAPPPPPPPPRSQPACSGRPSGPERRALAAWTPKRGCDGAPVPARRRRFTSAFGRSRHRRTGSEPLAAAALAAVGALAHAAAPLSGESDSGAAPLSRSPTPRRRSQVAPDMSAAANGDGLQRPPARPPPNGLALLPLPSPPLPMSPGAHAASS